MALRRIRLDGDELLRMKSREVDVVNERILTLLKDLSHTLYSAEGVGLAAPQIGVLKRVVVVDTGEGLIELINPVILEQSGEMTDIEGCLSIPGVFGDVPRPESITVRALDRNGEMAISEYGGFTARVICHEIDHLDGVLFKDKVVRFLDRDELEKRNRQKRNRG